MSDDEKKKGEKARLSVRIDPEDDQSLLDAEKKWPWRDRSAIVKTALRLGLQQLEDDPTPLGPPPVHIKILPPVEPSRCSPAEGPEAKVQRHAAAEELTKESKAILADIPPAEEEARKARGRTRKERGKAES